MIQNNFFLIFHFGLLWKEMCFYIASVKDSLQLVFELLFYCSPWPLRNRFSSIEGTLGAQTSQEDVLTKAEKNTSSSLMFSLICAWHHHKHHCLECLDPRWPCIADGRFHTVILLKPHLKYCKVSYHWIQETRETTDLEPNCPYRTPQK